MALSLILLIDLILMRPYCDVSEKLRGIFFGLIYIGLSLTRYLDESFKNKEIFSFLSIAILSMLGLALTWTYLSLGGYFYSVFIQKYLSKDEMI
jgi:hypothetical protein